MWKNKLLLLVFVTVVAFFNACEKDTEVTDAPYPLKIPEGFPKLEIPEDNKLTIARVQLGEKLFFDPILSTDSTISCGSCHAPTKAFADNKAISPGVGGSLGFRNAISLVNVAYQPYLFMDGGVPNLETQVLAPINGETEHNSSLLEVLEKLKRHPDYPVLFQKAYKREPDGYSLVRAIAAYERTLIQGNSRYDQYRNGNKEALSSSEKKGMELFFSEKTNCSKCHSGFNLTSFEFENNGLYMHYVDSGRARVTLNPEDAGKFKVSSLRNIKLTSPYMHDGSLKSLEEVLAHYESGGQLHENKSPLVKGFTLSDVEKENLISFLEAL